MYFNLFSRGPWGSYWARLSIVTLKKNQCQYRTRAQTNRLYA